MKKIIPMLLLCCVAAFAQSQKPAIAVYVTGGSNPGEDKFLNTRMFAALDKINLFKQVERADVFQDQVAKELYKQMDGSVANKEIRKAGKQFGVQYICVVEVAFAFGMTQFSARILDVETMEAIATGAAETEEQLRGAEINKMIKAVMDKITPGILKALERR